MCPLSRSLRLLAGSFRVCSGCAAWPFQPAPASVCVAALPGPPGQRLPPSLSAFAFGCSDWPTLASGCRCLVWPHYLACLAKACHLLPLFLFPGCATCPLPPSTCFNIVWLRYLTCLVSAGRLLSVSASRFSTWHLPLSFVAALPGPPGQRLPHVPSIASS